MGMKILMLKRLGALQEAVEISREHKTQVTGIDFEWDRRNLLTDDYDIELGFSDSPREFTDKWRFRANRWCTVNARTFFDTCLRNADLDTNLLVQTLAKTPDSKRIMTAGSGPSLQIRKAFQDTGRTLHQLKQFVKPQFDKVNMLATIKTRHRLADLFGQYLQARAPDLHIFVKWGSLYWVDGRLYPESKVNPPLIGENHELEQIWDDLVKANYIPSRRNPVLAKSRMPAAPTNSSRVSRRERFYAEVGLEKPLTDFV